MREAKDFLFCGYVKGRIWQQTGMLENCKVLETKLY